MSSNQKPVPQAPPQQSRCFTPQYPSYQPFSNTNKHQKLGADGGYHVSTSPAFGPQQGPPQQQAQLPMRGAMAPAGPPNQASTPPQTDGMKVPPMPSQPNIPMAFLQQGAGVRGNQNNFFRQMQPPTRSRQPIFQPPPVPAVYTTQLTQSAVVLGSQIPAPYQTSFQPRTTQGFYQLPFQPISTQPMYNYPNQPSHQPFFFQHQGGPPMNLISRTPQPTPAGAQGPNQPVATMPMNHPNQIQQPTVPKKTRRCFAIPIIDPTTGKDKLKELYDGDESAPQDSDESSARETPQPDSHVEITSDFQKMGPSISRVDDPGNEPDHRSEVPTADVLSHSEEMMQPDGVAGSKLGKKIEMIPPSESKLQAGTKEFIPEMNKNIVAPPPPRETPVVSASDGIEVFVCSKSSKERESPVKSRKARENAQRTDSNVQRESNLVQSTTNLMRENETSRDVLPPLVNPMSQLESKNIQHEPPVLQQGQSLRENTNIPKEQVAPHISQHSVQQKDSSNVNKESSAHHSDTTLATTKGKQSSKTKPSDSKFVDQTKNQVQNNNFPIPHGENLPGKNKANADSKKSISNKDAAKQSSVSSNATSSTPAPNQKQQQQQQQQQQQHATPQPATVPVSSAPTVPVAATQPPKPSNKTNKQRELLNRKGADKEGTDMDAFNTNDNNTQQPAPPIVNNNTNASTDNQVTTNTNTVTATSVIVDNKTGQPQPQNVKVEINDSNEISNNKPDVKSATLPKSTKVNVCDIVKDSPKPLPTKPATSPSQQIINKENEIDNKSTMSENDKLVQAKNEANAKASIVNSVSNNIPIIDANKNSTPASVAAAASQITYKEGQWSPDNPQGKKIYDREQLMALLKDPKSNRKPDLPQDLDVIKTYPKQQHRLAEPNRFSSMNKPHEAVIPFPQYGKSSVSQRGPLPKRNSQQGKIKAGAKPVIHVTLSLKEDVKLNETENAWKPARLKPGQELSEEDAKTEALYKKVRGVLNKLTPQKFDTLVSQVRNLDIDNCERLQGVIDLVFEKAIDEPNYSVAYALMCRELALMQVPVTKSKNSNSKEPEYVNFRKLLITRCQMEFEKSYVDETARNKRLKEIEEETDPEKKKELQILLEEDDRRVRLKSVGNVRFIGELFKQQMLTANIMMRCLNNLLTPPMEEENLECLCKLLITVGKDLEIDKKMSLQPYFQTMQEIVDKKHGKISSRVRFMLQDVIDLRNNKWIPRRQDLKPTTIDQIQKEADTEQLNIQLMNSAPLNTPRKDDRGSGASGGDRKRGGRPNVSEDGWSPAPSRGRTPFSVESSKLKSTKPTTIDDEKLGSRSTFTKWNRGSTPLSSQPTTTTNMYSALELMAETERTRQSAAAGSRNGSKDPYISKGPSMERYKSYEDGRGSRSGSQARSRDGSQARQQPPAPMMGGHQPPVSSLSSSRTQLQPAKQLTDEEFENHSHSILNDYLIEKSVTACESEIRRLLPLDSLGKFVNVCYTYTLEKTSNNRIATGKLITQLYQSGLLDQKTVCEGLQGVLDIVDDLIIDIPKIWDYLSELIVPLLAEGVLTFKTLKETAFASPNFVQQENTDDYPGKNPGKLFIHIFNLLNAEKGPSFVRQLWMESGLQFSDIIPSKQVASFIQDHHLEYLTGGQLAPASNNVKLTFDQIRGKLLEFFRNDVSFNHITEWISTNIGEEGVKEKEFIRALVTAVCEHSIQKMKLNEDIFKKHFNLLFRYIDNKPDREMQCLYALQAYIHKLEHPPGVLRQICHDLWDGNVLSLESFLQWEACKDPAEQEGKGVALKTLTSFFTAIKETEEDSSTSEVEVEE